MAARDERRGEKERGMTSDKQGRERKGERGVGAQRIRKAKNLICISKRVVV
jgi:hypothetical protein